MSIPPPCSHLRPSSGSASVWCACDLVPDKRMSTTAQVHLVPGAGGTRKAHHPSGLPGRQLQERRQRELGFSGANPAVLTICGGNCSLQTAARLKYLDIRTLVIEKNTSRPLGIDWRNTIYDVSTGRFVSLDSPARRPSANASLPGYNYMQYMPSPPWLASVYSSLEGKCCDLIALQSRSLLRWRTDSSPTRQPLTGSLDIVYCHQRIPVSVRGVDSPR